MKASISTSQEQAPDPDYEHRDRAAIKPPFPLEHEFAVVSLFLQIPEQFKVARPWVRVEHFQYPEAKFIVEVMIDLFDQHGVASAREIVSGACQQRLRNDDDFEPVVKLLDRPLSPSEAPIIKSQMAAWIQHQHYRLIYGDASIEFYRAGDYEPLMRILQEAQDIKEAFGESQGCLVESWEDISRPKNFRIMPTPWASLNGHRGGLETGDHVGIAGPTSAGKSQILFWIAAECVRLGLNVLYIDFENRAAKLLLNFAAALGRADALALDLKNASGDEDLANARNYIRQYGTVHPEAGVPFTQSVLVEVMLPGVGATELTDLTRRLNEVKDRHVRLI